MKQKYICVLALVLAIAVKDSQAQPANCWAGATDNCDDWNCYNDGATQAATAACVTSCQTDYLWDWTSATLAEYSIETLCAAAVTAAGTYCAFAQDGGGFGLEPTCNVHCATDDCNNAIYSPAPAAGSATSCVQCTSESTTDSCYTAASLSATACPDATYQFCTTQHNMWLDSNGAVSHHVVFRGCSTAQHDDGCRIETAQLDANTATLQTVMSCAATCNTTGCNIDALPMTAMQGGGSTCQYCAGSTYGSTACTPTVVTCKTGEDYCYTRVVYTDGGYYSTDAANDNYGVAFLYEERGCRSTPVTAACTTVESTFYGVTTVTCEETCQGKECNDHWPLRPKCSQCYGAYHNPTTGNLYTVADEEYVTWCKDHPPAPKKCADPTYKYCYVSEKFLADGDNEIKWGYSTEFERGCLKESDFSRCNDYKWRDEREAHFCQFVCDQDNCNLGSPATSIVLSTGSVAAAAVALFFKFH